MEVYVYLRYPFTDDDLWNIAVFRIPAWATEEGLCDAIDDAIENISEDDFCDPFERYDAIFDAAASSLAGSWEYLHIAKYIES